MPFEDLLKPTPKCKTCEFLATLRLVDPALADEIEVAIGKPIYSDQVLSNGMHKVESEFNQAPGEKSVGLHRERGHAE